MQGVDWSAVDAALFDLDGVVTPTAEVHMRAWAELFNGFLTTIGDDHPYTDADYFAHVDGKPRYDGVRHFLASRGIVLPDGTPEDDPSEQTVCGLGNRKNLAFRQVLTRDGIAAYPGSLALIDRLEALGVARAIVSSSRNARLVLGAAGLTDRFPVIVDGERAAAEGLAGKPAPDTFHRAADLLGVPYDRAVVLEDAISGVAAGRAGGFGSVIGVDRGVGESALLDAGADIVVTDLADLLPAA